MTNFKAIIIDDEPQVASLLNKHLESHPKIEVVATCHSAIEGIKAVNQHQPDLVFLDIEMPGGNGFDFLESFPKITFDIIFTTAYNEYALKAIKFAALDYLLKPISDDDLNNALQRFFEKQKHHSASHQIEHLLDNLHNADNQKIAIPEHNSISFVNVSDIVRCKSDAGYTQVFLKSGKKITASKPIGDFEELLSHSAFFRIHRSHLINLNEIIKYIKGEGGYVIMSDKSEVEVSRRKKHAFLEAIITKNNK